MIYAEILAGGHGKRFGNKDLPKQFMMLSEKPIIIHTIEQFVINKDIDKIIVCTPKNWISYTEDLIKKYIKNNDNIEVTCGGSTRNESIINGCKYIEKTYGINKDDIIVTHDAVRPFINQRIIEDNIKAGKKCSAVDTVIPATDTIIKSLDNKEIESIPNRSVLYYGQTPQTFNILELMELYTSLTVSTFLNSLDIFFINLSYASFFITNSPNTLSINRKSRNYSFTARFNNNSNI